MSPDAYIEKLLEELHSEQDDRRIEAIWLVEAQKIADKKIIEALRTIALRDPQEQIRNAASKTLNSIGFIVLDYETRQPIANTNPNLDTDFDTEKLLEELHSQQGNRRIEAIWSAGLQKITDKQVVETLKTIAQHDSDYQVRKAAYKTLATLGFPPDYDFKETDSPTKFIYRNPKSQVGFWQGFGLWFALNIVMSLCIWTISPMISLAGANGNISPMYPILYTITVFSPFVVNIGLMIYFMVIGRQQIALGMLAAFGLVFAFVACAGIFLMATCFAPITPWILPAK